MPIRCDPDRIRLMPGQFICTPLFNPEARAIRGVVRPNATAMVHSTAVMEVLRLGPEACIKGPYSKYHPFPEGERPAHALAPYARAELGIDCDWAEGPPTPWPFDVGAYLLTPRDFAMIVDWEGKRYAIGELVFVIALLEGTKEEIVEGFEVLPGWISQQRGY